MRFLFLAVALIAGSPAAAQEMPSLSLAPGEAVTVRFDKEGRAGAPERSRAAWSRFDVAAARQLAGQTPPDAPVPVGTPLHGPEGVAPDPIPPDEVRLRFMTIAGEHALLVVENGRGEALAYRARMTREGRTQATDVCIVLPHLPSYEHWAHRIDRLELSDFRFIRWESGRSPTCQ